MQIAKGVGPDWVNWTRDPSVLESARKQLGDQLNLLATSPQTPPPPTTGSSWQTGFVVGADNAFNDDESRNFRVIIPAGASGFPGTKIRITMQASAPKAGVIAESYIGEMSANGVFDKPPTKITWDGGAAGTTVSANSSKTSFQ